MKAVLLAEIYIEKLKKYNRPYCHIYCIRLLERCIKDCFYDADAACLNGDFLNFFFTQWLPYNMCQEEDDIIDMVYSRVKAFCKFSDRKVGTKLFQEMMGLTPFVQEEAKRVMYVKKYIMQFINSPLINKNPGLIDLTRYRKNMLYMPKKRNAFIAEEGYFKVADIFTNNSVVLKKISGYTFFIRVYFNEPVIEKIRPGDMLDMKVRYIDSATGWRVEDISGCLAREII